MIRSSFDLIHPSLTRARGWMVIRDEEQQRRHRAQSNRRCLQRQALEEILPFKQKAHLGSLSKQHLWHMQCHSVQALLGGQRIIYGYTSSHTQPNPLSGHEHTVQPGQCCVLHDHHLPQSLTGNWHQTVHLLVKGRKGVSGARGLLLDQTLHLVSLQTLHLGGLGHNLHAGRNPSEPNGPACPEGNKGPVMHLRSPGTVANTCWCICIRQPLVHPEQSRGGRNLKISNGGMAWVRCCILLISHQQRRTDSQQWKYPVIASAELLRMHIHDQDSSHLSAISEDQRYVIASEYASPVAPRMWQISHH